jgi:hypothetical protein
MTNKNDLADQLEAIAAQLRSEPEQTRPPARDWLGELLDIKSGDVINTDTAAVIIGCHADTARKRAVDTMEGGKPIATLVANAVWLFSEARILADIEARDGLPARLAAVTRAEKARNFRSQPSLSVQKPMRTESEPSTSRAKSARIGS